MKMFVERINHCLAEIGNCHGGISYSQPTSLWIILKMPSRKNQIYPFVDSAIRYTLSVRILLIAVLQFLFQNGYGALPKSGVPSAP